MDSHMEQLESRLTNCKKSDPSRYLYNITEGYHKKINIYNGEIDPLQKIWIKMPNLKAFKPSFKPNIKQSTPLTLLLSPSDDKNIKRFRKYIEKLESSVKDKLQNNDKVNVSKLEFKSCLNKVEPFPYHITINMPFERVGDCSEYSFNVYNQFNQRISPKKIDNGTIVSAYISVSHIWTNETKYGIHLDVLQMKLIPDFDFGKCLFIEEYEDEKNKMIQKELQERRDECYHCLYCPNNHVRTHVCHHNVRDYDPPSVRITRETREPQVGNFMPQIGDILKIKLKSINGNHENQKPEIIKEPKQSNAYGGFVPSLGDLLKVKNSLGKKKQKDIQQDVSIDYDKIIEDIDKDDLRISTSLSNNNLF